MIPPTPKGGLMKLAKTHRLTVTVVIIAFVMLLRVVAVAQAQTYVAPRAIVVANLYAGPGDDYEIVGTVVPSMPVPIVQGSADGQWYRSSNGAIGPWIAANALDKTPRPDKLWPLTPISQAPSPTPTPTPTQVVIVPTAMILPVDTPTPLPPQAEVPTATPNPDLAEIYTVGEWAKASNERRYFNAAVWTIALIEDGQTIGDTTKFTSNLQNCVDATVSNLIQSLGENFSIFEIAGRCADQLIALSMAAPPAVEEQPIPTEMPTATPIPVVEVPTATPTLVFDVVQPSAAAPCDCSGDMLNCTEDFQYQAEAQACHDYCVATVGFDIHGLDGNDNDGLACESLP